MTDLKKWPHEMKEARDNAAMANQEALRILKPLMKHRDIAVVAAVAVASSKIQFALRNLEFAQASTRPTRD